MSRSVRVELFTTLMSLPLLSVRRTLWSPVLLACTCRGRDRIDFLYGVTDIVAGWVNAAVSVTVPVGPINLSELERLAQQWVYITMRRFSIATT